MDTYLRLSNSAAGRDKIFRLLQYSSKFLGATLDGTPDGAANLARRIQSLEAAMSLIRKGLRLGKSIDALHGTVGTLRIRDPVVRATTTVSRIHQALYLLFDNLLWADNIGLISIDSPRRSKWNTLCNRFWLYYLTANLVRDLHEIHMILRARKKLLEDVSGAGSGLEGFRAALSADSPVNIAKHVVLSHGDVTVDFIRNLCDIFIPLSSLGYLKLPPSVVGMLGAVSSGLSVLSILRPAFKLNPS